MSRDVASNQILRRPAVEAATGYSRSRLYRDIARGVFPGPVRLGPRCVGWPAHEVWAVNAARISCQSDADLRALVEKLQAERNRGL